MHKLTEEIRNKMLHYEDIPDRLKVLHNAYKDEICYITTVGPSIKNYEEDYLRDKLKDELVITVKQAYNIFRELSDFQVLSFANFYHTNIIQMIRLWYGRYLNNIILTRF